MSKRRNACNIAPSTKTAVWRRDGCCIVCQSTNAYPNAHVIPRSQGGLGVEKNIVTLCPHCHRAYDQSERRGEIGRLIRRYLEILYPDWREEDLIYRKRE